jgi:predicted Zn-dependent protease
MYSLRGRFTRMASTDVTPPERFFMRLKLLPAALLLSLLCACGTAVINPVSGQTERSAMSEEQEIVEGQKGHQQVLKEYSVYNNPGVQDYVNALGQRLAAQSHRAHLQWHFTVHMQVYASGA